MNNLIFANPKLLYLLIIIPFLIAWYIWRERKQYATLSVPGFDSIDEKPEDQGDGSDTYLSWLVTLQLLW